MPKLPRKTPPFPPGSHDQAVLDRWGVSRCDAVEMESVSSELTRLMSETARTPDARDGIAPICQRRHSVQESRLEEAIVIARKAEAVHRQDDAWPHGLADQLEDILDQTIVHQQREQAVVFPMLLDGVEALPDRTIDEMIAAHEALLKRWRRLDQRTHGFKAPAHACAAWRLLYVLCFKLQADFQSQVDLENRMLQGSRIPDLRNDAEERVAHAQRR